MGYKFCGIAVLVCLLIGLMSCSSDSPKGLAKQMYEIEKTQEGYQELVKEAGAFAVLQVKGKEAAELKIKQVELQKKIGALSSDDKDIYNEELRRLRRE
jgi:hypothetical protein